ncbi:MAG: LptF/LptG family permease [Candidatus Omnitrophica bacterium]|nr:LptF/LptG family permease [Candidatus Omnitrophota bacterium]
MRILDKYLVGLFILAFIATVTIFLSLYIIIDLFSNLDEIIKNQLDFDTLRVYYLAFTPKIFIEIAPVAALLAMVYTLSRLNNTNEIIAMRSSGLSIWQITRVVLITGLAISCLVFFVSERILPASQYKLLEIKVKQMGMKDKHLSDQPIRNAAIYGLDNRLFFISLFDPKDNTLSGIVIFEQDENQNVTAKIVSGSGEYKDGRWILYDCITYKYGLNNELVGEPEYMKAKVMNFEDTPQDIRKQQLKISYMNVKQLRDYRQRLKHTNAKAVLRNFNVEIKSRFSSPMTAVILMFISIPFSLSIKRKGQLASSLGISIVLAFFYYVINSMSIAFAKEGFIPALVAAWLANAAFFLIGVVLIKRQP